MLATCATALRAQTIVTYTTGETATGTFNVADGNAIEFRSDSSAGSSAISVFTPGRASFYDTATAGDATINVVGNSTADSFSRISFGGTSSAGQAAITITRGRIAFNGDSNAGSSAVTVNDGWLDFNVNGSAGSSAITLNGQSNIYFRHDTDAAHASVTLNGGGTTLSVSSRYSDLAIGQLNGSGWVSMYIPAGLGEYALIIGDDRDSYFTGTIFGEGSLAKNGAGSLTLTHGSEHSGNTTINDGRLVLGDSIRGPITNNSVLVFDPAQSMEQGYSISGTGSVIKQGNGVAVLNDYSSYAGTTTVDAGVLNFRQRLALYHGDTAQWDKLTVEAGATAGFNLGEFNQDDVSLLLGLSSATQGFKSGARLGLSTFGRSTPLDYAPSLTDTFGGANILGVDKLDDGILVLSGPNTYTGGTRILGGSLFFGRADSLPSVGALTLAENAGIGFGVGGPDGFTAAGIQSVLGSLTLPASYSLGFDTSHAAGDFTHSSVLADPAGGTLRLIKLGAGTLVLDQTNSFTGEIQLYGGLLSAGSAANLGDPTGSITMDGGGLRATGSFTSGKSVQLGSGGGTFDVAGDATLVWTGGIHGPGGFAKDGAGTLVLAAASDHEGYTDINAGTLLVDAPGALANSFVRIASTGSVVFGSVTSAGFGNLGGDSDLQLENLNHDAVALTVGSSQGDSTYAGILSGSGSLTKTGGSTLTLTGANTYTGGTTIFGGPISVSSDHNLGAASGAINLHGTLRATGSFASAREINFGDAWGAIDVDAGQTLALSGNFSGNGGGFQKWGDGRLVLSGDSSAFAGIFQTWGGTLHFTQRQSITGWDNSRLAVFNGGTLGFNVGGDGEFTGADIALLGSGTTNVFLGGYLSVDTSNAAAAVTVTGGLDAGGLLGFTKLGAGTLTLAGDNTYTGATAINGGTLVLAGDTVSSGYTLAPGTGLGLHTDADRNYAADTVFSGTGTLRKTGSGTAAWNTGRTVFELGAGSVIDVQGGRLDLENNNYTSDWSNNFASLSVAAGATFNAADSPVRVDALAGDGTIMGGSPTWSGGSFTFGVANGSGTFSGVLADTPGSQGTSWIKAGTGTQILTGNSTTLNPVNIAAGTLQFGDGGTTGLMGNSHVFIGAAGTLAIDRSDDLSLAQRIDGSSGTLQKRGANTVTMDALLQIKDLQVGAGRLVLNGGWNARSISLAAGATLEVASSGSILGTVGNEGIISGAGTFRKTGSDTYDWTNAAMIFAMDAGGLIDLQSGTVNGSYAQSIWVNNLASLHVATGATFNSASANVRVDALSGGGTIISGTPTASPGWNYQNFTFGVANGSGTFSGLLTDNGSNAAAFVKTGTGTQVLSGANTFSGGLAIDAGTLSVSADANLGAASGALTFGDGTLKTTDSFSSARATTLGTGGTFDVSSGTTLTWNGSIGGAGALAKSGAGTLTLGATNTYAGGTAFNGGRVVISSDASLGAPASAVSFAGGTLATTASFTTARATTLNAGGGTFDPGAGTTLTWNGDIGGTGPLTKIGGGILELGGTNNYSGATLVNVGTLRLNSAGALSPATTLAVASGATFDANGFAQTFSGLAGTGTIDVGAAGLTLTPTGSSTFYGSLAGTGGLTLNGPGTQSLFSGAHTYAGATTVNGGTLFVNSSLYNQGTSAGSVVINSGGTLVLGNQVFGAPSSTPAVTLTVNAGGLVDALGGGSNAVGDVILNGGELRAGQGGGIPTLLLKGTVTVGGTSASRISTSPPPPGFSDEASLTIGNGSAGSATLFDVADATLSAAADLTITARLTSIAPGRASGLTKTGSGTLALEGDNDYAGTTTLAVGTLALNHARALGTSHLVITGGTLDNTSSAPVTLSTNNAQTWSSHLTFAGTQSLNLGSGAVTLDAHRTVTVAGNTLTVGGAIGDGNHGYALTKSGAGTLVLGGASTYSGGTTVNAGTLAFTHAEAFGTGAVTLNGGTSLQALSSVALGNNITLAGSSTFDASPATAATLSGEISGSGSLAKTGTGTIVLAGANTYTGGTFINQGAFQLGASERLANTGTLTLNGGTLELGAFNETVGAVSLVSGALVSSTGVLTGSSYQVQSGTISAGLAGSGALAKTGAGAVTLSGVNTFSGGTTLAEGTLIVAGNSSLGTGAVVLDGGTLQAGGAARTLANSFTLNADTTLAGNQALTLGGPLTLARNRDLTVTNIAVTTIAGAIGQSGGTRSLLKYGAGELQLTGASTYTGGTTIAEGTVRINNATGSAFGTGAVTVEAGATLAGAGSFTGALQLNGTFSPGNSPGITGTGSQTWAGGAGYVWEINNAANPSTSAGTSYDLLAITGTLTIAATSGNRFNLSLVSLLANNTAGDVLNFDSSVDSSYTIASASGGIIGFDSSAFAVNTSGFTNNLNGGAWNVSQAGNNLNLNFAAVSAIPEPSTYAVLAGSVALGLAVWRRRRAAS